MVHALSIQDLFRAIVGAIVLFFGWWGHQTWRRISRVEEDQNDGDQRLHHIEVLVAGRYVQKTDLRVWFDGLNRRLDRIENALDRKVDK